MSVLRAQSAKWGVRIFVFPGEMLELLTTELFCCSRGSLTLSCIPSTQCILQLARLLFICFGYQLHNLPSQSVFTSVWAGSA